MSDSANIPNAVLLPMCIHGHRLTERQMLLGLQAMVGNFRVEDVANALRRAGVPSSGPTRREFSAATYYIAACDLRRRAHKEGLVERIGYHGWKSRRGLASRIEARSGETGTNSISNAEESLTRQGDAQ